MCSGSDEHTFNTHYNHCRGDGHFQEVVDRYHEVNTKALAILGCSWVNNVDPRGHSSVALYTIEHLMISTKSWFGKFSQTC